MPLQLTDPHEKLNRYVSNLKALRFNNDRSLKFSFDFDNETEGLFSICDIQKDEDHYGKFKINSDLKTGEIKMKMYCVGFYVTPKSKLETMSRYQSHDYNITLNKPLMDLVCLHVRVRKTRGSGNLRKLKRNEPVSRNSKTYAN